jgi:ABC-type transport system substrate-binding protein
MAVWRSSHGMPSLCDKLVDIAPDLKIVPRLATSWEFTEDGKVITFKLRDGVTFQGGEKFDAAAVKFNVERAKTMPESIRKSELASVDTVEVVDLLPVHFNLKKPDSTVLAALTDRSGMMVAPEAAKQAGAKFGLSPVCSGPYKFVERVQQDLRFPRRPPSFPDGGVRRLRSGAGAQFPSWEACWDRGRPRPLSSFRGARNGWLCAIVIGAQAPGHIRSLGSGRCVQGATAWSGRA